MNKKNITIFSIIIFTAILGIIFISIGIKSSAKKTSYMSVDKNTLINKNYQITDNIKEIYIDASALQFEVIESSSVSNIEIAIKNFIKEEDMSYNIAEGRLYISSIDTVTIPYPKQILVYPKVIITLPINKEFDVFEVYNKASETILNNIKTKKLVINNGAGKVIFSGICTGGIDVNNSAGKVEVRLKAESKDITVKNSIGDVNIKTVDIDKYNYTINNSVGNVNIGNKKYSGLQNEISNGGGGIYIKINNSVGNVSVI